MLQKGLFDRTENNLAFDITHLRQKLGAYFEAQALFSSQAVEKKQNCPIGFKI